MDNERPLATRRQFLRLGGAATLTILGSSYLAAFCPQLRSSADAATLSIAAPYADRMPSNSALLKMNRSTFAKATWTGVTGKKVASATQANNDLLILQKGAAAQKHTFTDFLRLDFTHVGQIGDRYLDASMNFDKLVIAPRENIKTTDGEDVKNNYTAVAVLTPSLVAIGASNTADGSTYGYAFRGSRSTQVTVSFTWSDTQEPVDLPFFAAISDIDAPASLTNSWYREAWSADQGFTGSFWTWPSCYLSTSGSTFSAPGKGLTDGDDRWFKSGVIAPTVDGTCTSTLSGGGCTTNLTIYSTYIGLRPPVKSVDERAYVEGEEVVFTVRQKMGCFFEDTMDYYRSLELVDPIPPELEYRSASLEDESGVDLLPHGALTFNTGTQELRFSFARPWLEKMENYAGQELVWTIRCTARRPQELKCVAQNTATTLFSGFAYDSNTVEVTIIRSCLIHLTKRIRSDDVEWAHGDPTFVFAAKGRTQQGKDRTYRASVAFTKDDEAKGGWLTKELTLTVEPGTYRVSEEPCLRYRLESIQGDGSAGKDGVDLDMLDLVEASVTFVNAKGPEDGLSDVTSVVNHIGTTG